MLAWDEEPRHVPSAADRVKFQVEKQNRTRSSPFATYENHDPSWANSSQRQRVNTGGYGGFQNPATPWATQADVGNYFPDPTTKGRKAAPESSYASQDVKGTLAWEGADSGTGSQHFTSRRSQGKPAGGASSVVLGGGQPDEAPKCRTPPGGQSSLRLY